MTAAVIHNNARCLMRALTAMAALFLLTAGGAGAESVSYYGRSISTRPLPAESAALEALASVVRGYEGMKIKMDPGLVVAARELAGEVRSDYGSQERVISSDHTIEMLRNYGMYDTVVQTWGLTYMSVGDVISTVKLKIKPGHEVTHAGAGVAPPVKGKVGVLVIITVARRVSLEPFPRKVDQYSTHKISGSLVYSAEGLRPSVMLTLPRGDVKTLSAEVRGNRFSAPVPFDQGPGSYRIGVFAAGRGDSKLSALLVVEAGYHSKVNSGTFEMTGFDEVPEDEEDAQRIMVAMINRVRVKKGLSPLVVDPKLRRMAKSHSRDMAQNGFFGHNSPGNGSINKRADEFGLSGYVVRENLALNSDFVQAMNNLLGSPGHRVAIFDPDMTHLGVGVVIKNSGNSREYYVTQEFARLY